LVTNEDDGGLGAEVTNRLDELFVEEDDLESGSPDRQSFKETPPGKKEGATVDYSATAAERMEGISREDSPINNLKALVTEIEWEITDESMRNFLSEVDLLRQKYQNDPVLVMCLKLHESIGKYIKTKKVNSHPDAIKLLGSAFAVFERIVKTPGMSVAQQKKMLSVEVKAFKDFKQTLISRKRGAMAPAEHPMPAMPIKLENREAIDYLAECIVEKLKNTIRREVEKIRRDLESRGS
jgi:hypothetical protein